MTLRQSTAVAIGGRALLLEGAPGCGKSTLALALIDRDVLVIFVESYGRASFDLLRRRVLIAA